MKRIFRFIWEKILPYVFGIGLLFLWISPFFTKSGTANYYDDGDSYDDDAASSCDIDDGSNTSWS